MRCRELIATLTISFLIKIAQCESVGDVRIISDTVPYEGRVEVYYSSRWESWINICADVYNIVQNRYIPHWGDAEAKIVCRQLGYETSDIQPLISHSPVYRGPYLALTRVNCMSVSESQIKTLDDCQHSRNAYGGYCHLAAVQCGGSKNIRNIRATFVNASAVSSTNVNTVDIVLTWEQNTTVRAPTMFEIKCHSERHSIEIIVSNTDTKSTELGGLLHSSNYTCCVSAVYDDYMAENVCTKVRTTSDVPEKNPVPISTTGSLSVPSNSSSSNVVGGVLGFIIILLLILVVVLVVCLLRPDVRKKVLPPKLSQFVDSTSTSTLPVRANISYVTTPQSCSATENTYNNDRARGQPEGVTPAASSQHYSSIGPAYESLSSSTTGQGREERQDGGRRCEIPISERYEFADIHTDTDRHVQVGVGASDYEVPRESVNLGQDYYSHLQH